MKFERIVKFSMPYDKRTNNPKTNYGISAMRIWFILKGRKGAVQVLMGTNLYLVSLINECCAKSENMFKDYAGKDKPTFDCWDVGVHSRKKPDYMDESSRQECSTLGKCYYDGSGLRGMDDQVAEMFLARGEEAIWEYLEKYYEEVFGPGIWKATKIFLEKSYKKIKKKIKKKIRTIGIKRTEDGK